MGLTQQEFMESLGYSNESAWQICSKWERGLRECDGLDAVMVRHFEASHEPRGEDVASKIGRLLEEDEGFSPIEGVEGYWLTTRGRVISTKGARPSEMTVKENGKGRFFTARTPGGRERVFIEITECS